MGYDQWKTASPYDDEPDAIEEAERFLARMKQLDPKNYEIEDLGFIQELQCATTIIELLLSVLDDEGLYRRGG